MSDAKVRFEAFKELLLAYTKPIEEMEAAHIASDVDAWRVAARAEATARLALYDWAIAALADPAEPQGEPVLTIKGPFRCTGDLIIESTGKIRISGGQIVTDSVLRELASVAPAPSPFPMPGVRGQG